VEVAYGRNDTAVILHTGDNYCGEDADGLLSRHDWSAPGGRVQPARSGQETRFYGRKQRPFCHGESREQDQRVYSGLVQYQVLDNRFRAANAPMIMINPASRAAIQAVPNEAWTPAPNSSE
jgi:hypothetical protein